MMNSKNTSGKAYDIKERTFEFGLETIKVISGFPKNTIAFELGKQLIRSGTSIGANIEEATGARTKKEFVNSINISKKEARESNYWLRLIFAIKLTNSKKLNH